MGTFVLRVRESFIDKDDEEEVCLLLVGSGGSFKKRYSRGATGHTLWVRGFGAHAGGFLVGTCSVRDE